MAVNATRKQIEVDGECDLGCIGAGISEIFSRVPPALLKRENIRIREEAGVLMPV